MEDLVGHLGGGGPDLAAVDHVAIVRAFRLGGDGSGIQSSIGFGHAERAFLFAFNNRRQPALFLFIGAENRNGFRAEDVHVYSAGGLHSAGGRGDGSHHNGGRYDAKVGAAYFFWEAHAEPSAFGHGAIKLFGKAAVAVFFQPILVSEVGQYLTDPVLYCALFLGLCEIHGLLPSSVYWAP